MSDRLLTSESIAAAGLPGATPRLAGVLRTQPLSALGGLLVQPGRQALHQAMQDQVEAHRCSIHSNPGIQAFATGGRHLQNLRLRVDLMDVLHGPIQVKTQMR